MNDVIGGNNGTPSGTDAFTGGAMNFAGRAGGVPLARDDIATVLGGSASVSFHMKTTQNGNANAWNALGIFARDQDGSGDNDVFRGLDRQHRHAALHRGQPIGHQRGRAVGQAGQRWLRHHVVMTRDAVTGTQAMYIDGVRTAGAGNTGVKGLANKFQLLGQLQGSPDFFRGSLSNVRVYGRAIRN